MRKPRALIKLGGAALESTSTLEYVTKAIREYRDAGFQVILVHGGGPAINAELRRLGITWEFVGGQRVTTLQMMDVIEYTLAGTVNRRLNHHFRSQKLPVRGCSGSEHGTLMCSRASAELGQVGKIEFVNTRWLEMILAQPGETIPVVAPLGTDGENQRFNINADWAAAHLAVALGAEQLIFLTDQRGIMDEEGHIIGSVDADGLRNMIEAKMVSGGMLTKTLAILHALKHGLKAVRVMCAQDVVGDVPYGSRGTACIPEQLVHEFARGDSHAAI